MELRRPSLRNRYQKLINCDKKWQIYLMCSYGLTFVEQFILDLMRTNFEEKKTQNLKQGTKKQCRFAVYQICNNCSILWPSFCQILQVVIDSFTRKKNSQPSQHLLWQRWISGPMTAYSIKSGHSLERILFMPSKWASQNFCLSPGPSNCWCTSFANSSGISNNSCPVDIARTWFIQARSK